MDELNTISEHELREHLWAAGDDADPTQLTGLADDALQQARRQQRTLHTAVALSAAVVVAAVGVTTSALVGRSQHPASVAGQGGVVKLTTPILLEPVESEATGSCKSGGYPGAPGVSAWGTSCFHVDSAHGMTVTELASIEAMPVPTSQGPDGWEVKLTFVPADKAAFSHLSANTSDHQLAVIIDGEVVNAPQIEGAITTGTFPITGYSHQAANTLVSHLTGK